MIRINQDIEQTLLIPRNTEGIADTLEIHSEISQRTYTFNVTDDGAGRYYKIMIDADEIPEGEYNYTLLNDEGTEIALGLLQVGEAEDAEKLIIYGTDIEYIQYTPKKKVPWIRISGDTSIGFDTTEIHYGVRANEPWTQTIYRKEGEGDWTQFGETTYHQKGTHSLTLPISANTTPSKVYYQIAVGLDDNTTHADLYVEQDKEYFTVYCQTAENIAASATEISYSVSFNWYNSYRTGTTYLYKDGELLYETDFGRYPYGFSSYYEIPANTSFEPVNYEFKVVMPATPNEPMTSAHSFTTQEAAVNYRAKRFTIEMLEDGDINWNVTGIYYNLNPDGGPDQNREIGQYYDPNDRKWKYGINNLHTGDVVEFYVTEDVTQTLFIPYHPLTSTADHKVYGNVMSLYYVNFAEVSACTFDYQFAALFASDKGLIDASNLSLPAEVLSERCYSEMFENCSNLEAAPKLPATYLAPDCYTAMFMDCTSLVDAPALPATNLATRCYYAMFSGCISLTSAPALPSKSLTAECYSGMFGGCSALIYAPKLPAQYLVYKCYEGMFWRCSSLNYIECLATDGLLESPLYPYPNTRRWVEGVSATGEFYTAEGGEGGWGRGVDEIPEGWDVNP